MCLFKKKTKETIDSKFSLGDRVSFKDKEEFRIGVIQKIRKTQNNEIVYDVQVGGECPSTFNNVKEDNIHLMPSHK